MQQIDQNFLIELFKACLISRSILDITIKHLKYQYLPNKHYKALFEKIVQQYELTNIEPTIGVLSQSFSKDEEVLKILHKVRNVSIGDKKEIILDTFEKFLINAKFVDLYTRIGVMHNEGNQEKAIEILEKEGIEIANFSIKDTLYHRIFADFSSRQQLRSEKAKDITNLKVPYSIHGTDYYSYGGINLGTSACILGRSGAGKSTFLRWVGGSAARLGYKVVHFQGEGTEDECFDMYDAMWTGTNLDDMEFGNIDPVKVKAILKTQKDILARGGDVYIKASESFDELSINDCRDIMEEIQKIHGKIHLAVFDYAELFSVKGKYYNSESGERKRREDISNKITNIATLFNCGSLTATQANDIKPDKWNDPNFVLTRSDISEFKGFIKPFSSFITINQTADEYDSGLLRIHHDKFRKKKSGQTITIAQSLDNSRFYDAKKTLDLFWDERSNKPKH